MAALPRTGPPARGGTITADVLTDETTQPRTNEHMVATGGNALDALGAYLAGLGMEDNNTVASVESLTVTYLSKRNLRAEFDGLRYGKLTLAANHSNARLIALEKSALLEHLQNSGYPNITDISVRVNRD